MKSVLAFAALIITVLQSTGCGANVRTDGRTGGVRLEMLHEGTGNLVEFYKMDREGTLHFAGGQDAQRRRITWSDAMTNEEITQLIALLEREKLFTDKPPSTGEPRDVRTQLEVIGPLGHQTIRPRGQCEAVDQLREALSDIAARRFEGFMRTLPQPNVREDEATDGPGGETVPQ